MRLVESLDLPGPADDARFRPFADRLAHRGALVPVLEDAFRRRSTAECLARLRGRVPVAPVYTVDEAQADEQVAAREMIVDVEHPVFGSLRQLGCPIKIEGSCRATRRERPWVPTPRHCSARWGRDCRACCAAGLGVI